MDAHPHRLNLSTDPEALRAHLLAVHALPGAATLLALAPLQQLHTRSHQLAVDLAKSAEEAPW